MKTRITFKRKTGRARPYYTAVYSGYDVELHHCPEEHPELWRFLVWRCCMWQMFTTAAFRAADSEGAKRCARSWMRNYCGQAKK